ncbi:probable auxin efflux carrier component 5b [Zingiber officinale]|nr:probable auxin efflux carrier component 5b [Zingiber officinale]
MIRWGDVYKVVEAMAPLYVALGLGYASVRRWRFFTADQCDAVHRLVVYFVVPFFSFRFTAGIDPFALRVSVLAADALTKLLMAALLAAWHRWGSCSAGWVLTVFSLAQLTNTLVVGAPMLEAMYGRWAQDVVVQISVAQGVVYFPAVLFMLEMIKARPGGGEGKNCEAEGGGGSEEGNEDGGRCRWSPVLVVLRKLAVNPNVYASVLGLAWSFLAKRWNLVMPGIIQGSVLVMANAGTGMSMFSLGLFTALQEKVIMCGLKQATLGMFLKFIAGPAAGAVGALVLQLRGDLLRVAIIQNALPQAISSFVYAREYGVHPDVLCTGVIFGTVMSLPVLVAYYVVLGLL